LACFLPFGKAEDTASLSLPRVRGSTLQRHPWTSQSYSILNFCDDRVYLPDSDDFVERIIKEADDQFKYLFSEKEKRKKVK